MRNYYLDGMMGLIVGDAVGVPYEFSSRGKLAAYPASDMIGYGTYNVPAGTWSDDSSMALAALDNLRNGYDPENIMQKFTDWLKMVNTLRSVLCLMLGAPVRVPLRNIWRMGI